MEKRWCLTGLLIIGILCGVMQGYGQNKPEDYGIRSNKALKLFFLGKSELQYRNYRGAVERFKEALEIEPHFYHALYYTGAAYYHLKQYEAAIPYLEKALSLSVSKPFIEVEYYLGSCYFRTGKYEQSYEHLSTFLQKYQGENVDLLTDASFLLMHASFAKEAVKNPIPFQPVNLGEKINSPQDDYMPYLTADESMIFFTSRREGSTGGYNAYLKGYAEDFYYAYRNPDGTWGSAKNLGPPINTEENEGAACISQDGQEVYYTACKEGNCDLYVATFEGNRWSYPKRLPEPVNSPFWDTQPCIANDGKTLYFVSNRPEGQGGSDIWVTYKIDGKWSPPQNLGPIVNTPGNEYAPFIHADGKTLYFASDYHPGFGGVDLFMTTLTDTGWTQPKNLGYPLNTHADERNIWINPAGNRGYYNSNRSDSYGLHDIYTFEMAKENQPSPATFVRGFVYDSLTKKPLQAQVSIIDLKSGDTIRSVRTNPLTGQFIASLPLNREYAAYTDAKGYLFSSLHFSPKGDPSTVYYHLHIPLLPIQKGAAIVLNNIFFDFDKSDLKPESKVELEKVVQFLKQNPNVRIRIEGHTDSQGDDSYNLRLSERRAESVKNYLVQRGINPSRITTKGYGETRPIASNETEEGRALNRRTELHIIE